MAQHQQPPPPYRPNSVPLQVNQPKQQTEPSRLPEKPLPIAPEIRFENKLADLLEAVLRRRMEPSASVRALHDYWKALSAEDKDILMNPDVWNIRDIGQRMKSASDMLANEMPALIASHQSTKGY